MTDAVLSCFEVPVAEQRIDRASIAPAAVSEFPLRRRKAERMESPFLDDWQMQLLNYCSLLVDTVIEPKSANQTLPLYRSFLIISILRFSVIARTESICDLKILRVKGSRAR